MTTVSFEEYFRNATTSSTTSPSAGVGGQRILPPGVLIAADDTGSIRFRFAEGDTGLGLDEDKDVSSGAGAGEGDHHEKGTREGKRKMISEDSTFWIASCTKLLTAVAALQCVERGLVGLDDDLRADEKKYLGKWWGREENKVQVLEGWDSDGEPKLRQISSTSTKITLRMLLTHSAGMGYEFLSEEVARWWRWRGPGAKSVDGDLTVDYHAPLLYEPGQGWTYSPSIDWTGILVSQLTSTSLSAYMEANIWKLLGLTSTAFRLSDLSQVAADNLVPMIHRDPKTGNLTPVPADRPFRSMNPKADAGGGGLISSPADYIKVLISLLRNDGLLLKPETGRMMFEPQLAPGSPAHAALLAHLVDGAPGAGMFRAGAPPPPNPQAWNFSFAGLLNTSDVPGFCHEGTVSWSGLPNLFWWIDRRAGTCGLYAQQLVPAGDEEALQMVGRWRREMWERFARKEEEK